MGFPKESYLNGSNPKAFQLNAVDKLQNWSLLHFAIYYHRYQIACFLISEGVDTTLQDNRNMQPIDLIDRPKIPLLQMLRRATKKEMRRKFTFDEKSYEAKKIMKSSFFRNSFNTKVLAASYCELDKFR